MGYETDERLKSFLDTNQLHREQLCAAILAIDGRFSCVEPQHPRGGPDGGSDLIAKFEGSQSAIGAVGFLNQATDSSSDRRKIKKKFLEDMHKASSRGDTQVFAFLTNVNLTRSEREESVVAARAAGFGVCEIFDRERLRLILDSPDGLAIRFQYLGLPLSDAEQAAFFSKWGTRINDVIADGFGEAYRLLNRIQFLHEYRLPIKQLRFMFSIKDECSLSDVGPVRLYARLLYDSPKGGGLVGHQFSMIEENPASDLSQGGSFSMRTLELHMRQGSPYFLDPECWNHYDYKIVEGGKSYLSYSGSTSTIQFRVFIGKGARDGAISLSDLDGAYLYFYANRALASSISKIDFYSDMYKLDPFGGSTLRNLNIQEFQSGFDSYDDHHEIVQASLLRIGLCFAPFRFDFSRTTPARVEEPIQVQQ